uniref:Tropinone reductase I n=1 Tax=Aegilops tauschii subsp. strangulata TaxID=200361 RepID=A0A453CFL0_AEGTS
RYTYLHGAVWINRHAIVEELAMLGARVHTCSRNAAELEECRRRWEDKNLRVTVSVCDVSVRAEREKLMDTLRQTLGGKLDILVNNAGQSMVKAATECTGEDYALVMATNIESCFHLAQLAHPLLLRSAGGGASSVVHISSIAGFVGFPGLAVYSMTKGAMNQLTRSLAAEWAGDGIRVNCVAPGGINTDIAKDMGRADNEGPGDCEEPGHAAADAAAGRDGGGGIGGGLPLHASGVLHHRPSHLRRRRTHHSI